MGVKREERRRTIKREGQKGEGEKRRKVEKDERETKRKK